MMKRGSMTVLGNTTQKHLTGTAVRSYNLLKQQREIQMHKTELLSMEFHCLHLRFCKMGCILTTEGQISQLGNTHHFNGNLSISSDFSCEQIFSRVIWPVPKLCLSLAAACCDNIRQGNIKLRTICGIMFGNTLNSASLDMPKDCNPASHLPI